MRVVIIKDFVQSNFPATPLLNYAMEVEKITTSKVSARYNYTITLVCETQILGSKLAQCWACWL